MLLFAFGGDVGGGSGHKSRQRVSTTTSWNNNNDNAKYIIITNVLRGEIRLQPFLATPGLVVAPFTWHHLTACVLLLLLRVKQTIRFDLFFSISFHIFFFFLKKPQWKRKETKIIRQFLGQTCTSPFFLAEPPQCIAIHFISFCLVNECSLFGIVLVIKKIKTKLIVLNFMANEERERPGEMKWTGNRYKKKRKEFMLPGKHGSRADARCQDIKEFAYNYVSDSLEFWNIFLFTSSRPFSFIGRYGLVSWV